MWPQTIGIEPKCPRTFTDTGETFERNIQCERWLGGRNPWCYWTQKRNHFKQVCNLFLTEVRFFLQTSPFSFLGEELWPSVWHA